MSDTVKVYTPEVVQDTPFPGDTTTSFPIGQPTGGVFTQETVSDRPLPVKRMADEVISKVINTRSRKILGEFQLEQFGGIRVGKYEQGVTGDIRMTPLGIVARDITGQETFFLDGETGDAAFAGTMRAGATIVNGNIVTEAASTGNGRTVYYDGDIPAIVIGDPS